MNALASAETLAAFALRGAWESALLAGFAAGLFRFLPGLAPHAKTALAGTLFALAVLLPCFSPGTPSTAQAEASGLPVLTLPVYAATVVCGLWLAASAVLLTRLAIGAVSLVRLLRAAQPAAPALNSLYRGLVRGRAGRARLLLAEGLDAPSACGLLRPAILLPRSLVETLPRENLAAILRHEAAHLNGCDDWLALALTLARAAFPFTLGLKPLERCIRSARESACDRAALAGGLAPRCYAACLVRLAESAPRQRNALAPGLAGARPELSARVEALLFSPTPLGSPGMLRSLTAAAAGSMLCLGMLASPSLVSFTSGGVPPEEAAATRGIVPATGLLRPASLVLSAPAQPASHHAAAARKRRASSYRRPLPARSRFRQVVRAPEPPRIFILVPAAQAVPARIWTRIVFITL